MKIIYIIFFFFSFLSFSQSKFKEFNKLSSPEKCWVVFHPFKAKKARAITKNTLRVTDSLSGIYVLDDDINGGQLDAFKHSYWIAQLSVEIGKRSSLKLGIAHEKGNYRTYKKMKLEEGIVPDKVSSDMDLFNNKMGAQIANENKDLRNAELINILIHEIRNGKMKIIKKDSNRNYLSCDGNLIPRETLKGLWESNKCLVSSKLKVN